MKRDIGTEVMRLHRLIGNARRRLMAAMASGDIKRAMRAARQETAADRRLSQIACGSVSIYSSFA